MALFKCGRALLVCCCCCQGLLAAAFVRGVEPGSEGRYAGSSFQCAGFDGSTLTLTSEAINDDGCDCADGSDEPGTGACAGQDITLFFCANKGSTSRRIYASRVDDGLCDCCDGSDEALLAKRFPSSACPNTCAEDGARERQEAEKQVTLLRAALQKQEEIIQGGLQDRATWTAELEQLNIQLTDFQKAFDDAKVAADVERAAEEERKRAEEAAKAAASNASTSLCMWRQTGGCDPSGEREPSNDKPCTEFIIAGSSGYCDCNGDGVQAPEETGYTCEASSGHSCEAVCSETPKAETAEEAPAEETQAEEKPQVSEYSKWMDGAAETLSAEETKEEKQVSEYAKWMEGAETATDAGEDAAADTPPEASTPTEEATAQEDPEASAEQKPSAVALETEARSKLESHKAAISSVQGKLDSIGSDDHLGYADLSGKTLSKHISEWTYKIDFFNKAMQDHTSLGDWSQWTGKTTAEFDRGTMCWGGPARKLNVKFECSLEQEIVDVFEPSRCVYEATVKHPGACDKAELEMLTTGTRIIGPKDEL